MSEIAFEEQTVEFHLESWLFFSGLADVALGSVLTIA